jgi:hypothetical protein
MPGTMAAPIETLERVAGEAARWLASPAARGSQAHRRDHVAHLYEALEAVEGPGCRTRVDALEAPPVDDGSPLCTFLTLGPTPGPEAEAGVLVLYGVHTALVLAQAGVPGCRMARLDSTTGRFVVIETAWRMPPSGPVQLLGGRTVGAAIYRVLLGGGAVMGTGLDPDLPALDPRPTRDRVAALLLEAAGGEWISPAAFGSTRVLAELAAHRVAEAASLASLPPRMAEPLFGSRGLFRP